MQIAIIFFLIFSSSIFANECKVDSRIMYAIAEIEGHPKTPTGYPYLISINSHDDQKKAWKDFKNIMLDHRTIDCQNKEKCVEALNVLIIMGIENVDCGAYQVNYKYWKMPKRDYFDVEKSYEKACDIVMGHNKNKWSWENVAKYHSKTKNINEKYKKSLLAHISRELN